MKILVLGSGPELLGKTGYYERFAVQAIQFLRNAGHEVVWVDDNPATLASANGRADGVYLEPLTLKVLENIIELEKPDSITHFLGGYQALHLLIFLDRDGVLDRHEVKVLGTPVSALKRLLDEEVLKKTLADLDIPFIETEIARNTEDCINLCRSIGFPLMLRPALALEGVGGYLVYNVEEVQQYAHFTLNSSPVKEVIIQKVQPDWIQLAIEGIHDPKSSGHFHVVGTLEALEGGADIHLGNSVVMAPAPSLHKDLESKVIDWAGQIADHLKICGSLQFRLAYSPESSEMVVLRVNHGLNRFSSFLSMLHNIPLGQVNASITLGDPYNPSTKSGDPKLNAIRVPIPVNELPTDDNVISTMLSFGAEVFVGRTPIETLAKAIGLVSPILKSDGPPPFINGANTDYHSAEIGGGRLSKIFKALEAGDSELLEGPHNVINPSILPALKELASLSSRLRQVKNSDDSGAPLISQNEFARMSWLVAEKGASLKNYRSIERRLISISQDDETSPNNLCFLSTVTKAEKGPSKRDKAEVQDGTSSILFLGPGPYRTGWGSEVDQALVEAALALKEKGHRAFIINPNPDSASLDLDLMEGICLETVSLDSIETILEAWSIDGVIHQFCPSIPAGLEGLLEKRGIAVFGTPIESIKKINAQEVLWENLEKIGAPLLSYSFGYDPDHVLIEAAELGYPVLVRLTNTHVNPQAAILHDEGMVGEFLDRYEKHISRDTPLFLEKFQDGMIGAGVLALCDGTNAFTLTFIENIEEYGVHGGDCASVIPTLSLGDLHKAIAKEALKSIAAHFQIKGHVYLDLAIKGRNLFVTGVWPYPSRNIPRFEKSIGHLIDGWSAELLLGAKMEQVEMRPWPEGSDRFFVKEAVFPYSRFLDFDPVLSPKMNSTGQVCGNDNSFGKAYFKSQLAVHPKMPTKGNVFVSVRDSEKEAIFHTSKKLVELGFSIVSTQGTAQFLTGRGIDVLKVHKVSGSRPHIIDLIKNGEISLVINIPLGIQSKLDESAIRRVTIEHNIPLITTTSGAFLFACGIEEARKSPLTFTPL